jgi:hypothetical protein
MSPDSARQRLWLCLPPITLCAFDGCVTLWGQPAAYWAGDRAAVYEGNPLAAWLLALHPLAFAAAGVPYGLLLAGAILRLPRRCSEAVAVLFSFSHAVGVLTWTGFLMGESPGALALLVPAAVLLLLAAWWRCGRRFVRGHPVSDHTARRRLGLRLLGVAVLVALAYPLSLGPACWALSWLQLEEVPAVAHYVSSAYGPLAPAALDGPEPVRRGLRWWIGVGMPGRTEFHGDWPRGVGWSNPGYTFTLWHD